MAQLLGLSIGIILSVMITINGTLTDVYGAYVSAVIIHIVGTVFSLVLCLIRGEDMKFWHYRPKWIYLGGVIGVATTFFNNLAFGKISITAIVALGLLGQTVFSLFVDTFGLLGMKKHPFRKSDLVGLLISLAGIYIMGKDSIDGSLSAILLSLGAGISVVLSRSVNARLSENIGALPGSFVNHLTGLPVTILLLLLFGEPLSSISVPENTPLWIYIGGLFGVTVVMLFNIVVPKIPAFQVTLLSFTGQIFTGILIDLISGRDFASGDFKGGIVIAGAMVINILTERILRRREQYRQ